MDASVKSLEDLAGKDGWPRLLSMVRGGASLVEAYRGLYYDELAGARAQQAAQAGRQAALNQAAGKGHLEATGAQPGRGPVEVPDATMQLYREMFPDMSESEIRKAYSENQ